MGGSIAEGVGCCQIGCKLESPIRRTGGRAFLLAETVAYLDKIIPSCNTAVRNDRPPETISLSISPDFPSLFSVFLRLFLSYKRPNPQSFTGCPM